LGKGYILKKVSDRRDSLLVVCGCVSVAFCKVLALIVAGVSRARSLHSGGPHVVGYPFLLIALTWNDLPCLVPLRQFAT
jgi:hypothetical protein